MPDSDRGPGFAGPITLVLVLIMIGVILFQKSGYEHVNPVSNVYESSSYKERADQRIESECRGLDGIASFECKSEIVQSTRDAHRAQKDLKAQRYMALWAFIMAVSSIAGICVTVFGLVYIKRTLDATNDAVKSADDAVRVTREIGQAQSRAYVTFSGVDYTMVKKMEDGNIRDIWLNTLWDIDGQSPALRVSVDFETVEDFQNASMDFKRSLGNGSTERAYGSVKSRRIGRIGLNFDRLEGAFRDGKAFWILAYLEYQDVFGSTFFYSEKISLTPANKKNKVFFSGENLSGLRINSVGIWGSVPANADDQNGNLNHRSHLLGAFDT